jgi:hypothetical protein
LEFQEGGGSSMKSREGVNVTRTSKVSWYFQNGSLADERLLLTWIYPT